MKKNIDRMTILFWDAQYQQQIKGTFLEVLLRTKLNEYFHSNNIMISASKSKKEEIFNEFILKDENGAYKTEMKGEPPTPTIILKEPLREKEFEEKMTALMSEVIAIEI